MQNIFIYLESYCYIKVIEDSVLLYNTLSKNIKLLIANRLTKNIFISLVKQRYCFVSFSDISKNDKDVFSTLRDLYFLDYIQIGDTFKKPIIMDPFIHSPLNIEKIVKNNIYSIIKEIHYFPFYSSKKYFGHFFNGIDSYCNNSSDFNMEEYNKIIDIHNKAQLSKLFLYINNINDLHLLLTDFLSHQRICVISVFGEVDTLEMLKLYNNISHKIYYYPADSKIISEIKHQINGLNSDISFYCLIDDNCSQIIENNPDKKIFRFNRNNKLMLNHCIDEEMIKLYGPDNMLIRFRNNINNNLFGKIYIDGKNNVFDNFFIKNNYFIINDIIDAIKSFTIKDQYWTLTRKDVIPCKKCLYSVFCPFITSHEIINENYCNVEYKLGYSNELI
ncbi:MAG: hypothetical protein HY951_14400 [Bacteroidia bacterium]|nr:hypothetical protein [Bacteroidia bacterium]